MNEQEKRSIEINTEIPLYPMEFQKARDEHAFYFFKSGFSTEIIPHDCDVINFIQHPSHGKLTGKLNETDNFGLYVSITFFILWILGITFLLAYHGMLY